jgi:putative FmdB family regulatory protein
MPAYDLKCTRCGVVEVFSRAPRSFDIGFCPQCGRPARKIPSLAGLPPFKAYWSEALCPVPGKAVEVTSRSDEKAMCRELNCVRVS